MFEIDMGSRITIMNAKAYTKIQLPLNPTQALLSSYTGHKIDFLGSCHVLVTNRTSDFTGKSFVANRGPNLISREWIQQLKLWPRSVIHGISQMTLENLMDEFRDLFSEDLGCLKHQKAKLFLKGFGDT